MLGITDPGIFVAGVIAIVLLPGPNSLYVLTVAARSGMARGYAGAAAIVVGDTVLMTAAALGAASVLHNTPTLYAVLRWAGALYLSWLGIKLIFGTVMGWRAMHQNPQVHSAGDWLESLKPVAEHTSSAVFRKALVISLLNPKAILFFLSWFAQFVDPTYPWPVLSFLTLGAIVQFFSLLYLSSLILAGAKLAHAFRQRKRLSALLNTSVGLMFVAFGLRLAT